MNIYLIRHGQTTGDIGSIQLPLDKPIPTE